MNVPKNMLEELILQCLMSTILLRKSADIFLHADMKFALIGDKFVCLVVVSFYVLLHL